MTAPVCCRGCSAPVLFTQVDLDPHPHSATSTEVVYTAPPTDVPGVATFASCAHAPRCESLLVSPGAHRWPA